MTTLHNPVPDAVDEYREWEDPTYQTDDVDASSDIADRAPNEPAPQLWRAEWQSEHRFYQRLVAADGRTVASQVDEPDAQFILRALDADRTKTVRIQNLCDDLNAASAEISDLRDDLRADVAEAHETIDVQREQIAQLQNALADLARAANSACKEMSRYLIRREPHGSEYTQIALVRSRLTQAVARVSDLAQSDEHVDQVLAHLRDDLRDAHCDGDSTVGEVTSPSHSPAAVVEGGAV